MTVALVVFLGLIDWFATTIIVEAEITEPIREWGDRHLNEKVAYLLHCHMCCGTWVGLALAATFGSPFPGLPGIAAGGLLYKAIAHLVLELRPQSWYLPQQQTIDFDPTDYATMFPAPIPVKGPQPAPNTVDGDDQWCCSS